MNKINVAIVDDQNLFRQSLALLINSVEIFKLAGDYPGGEAFIEALNSTDIKVDVAIIDLDMPGMNGVELNKILHKKFPNIKIVILSVHINDLLITQLINAGAASYMAKNCDKDELTLAIKTVYQKGFYFNTEVLRAIRLSSNHKHNVNNTFDKIPVALSKREKQLLQLICKEYNNSEIAEELFLSVRTVEGHRKRLINKVNCRNTAGLVLFAIRYNLFQLSI
ncbi:response regulator [Mucilaginibacter segetis]|uniref:Response regulator transcription factor n=1 Tax=Mucilaginibacter segetis TaxID=2793071 RepID=A0A934PT93_9SPHI|nr:response regulator transcription factor [Mucilaginibacter segetis]MBK0379122.1 response regulator transcription factor [Mucilaginibacter segetis]